MDPSSQLRVLLIVPAYNEEEAIESTARTIEGAGYDYIIVNDGSTDETLKLCRANHLPVINLSSNLGIGGAVQTGYMYARENDYDVAVQFDGDGQHDIAFVPLLVNEVKKGSDLVIGSRFLKGSNDEGFRSSRSRRMGIRWLSALIKLLTGVRIRDVTSGFRAASIASMTLFERDYPMDYPEPEAIVLAIRHHLKVTEVPVRMMERQGGSSSIKALSSFYYMVKVSLAVLVQGLSRPRQRR